MIITWCDRHLAAIHALATLMTDEPAIVAEAMAEVLAAPPADTCITSRSPWRKHCDRRLSSAQCPVGAAPLDRLELALHLLGNRTCASVSRTLGLPEHIINARLLGEMRILLASCESMAVLTPGHR